MLHSYMAIRSYFPHKEEREGVDTAIINKVIYEEY